MWVARPDIVVVGQLARDLVLVMERVPAPGESALVRQRREMLGGKGASQAVALAQLGMRPALVAVAGDDETGERLLRQARRDGIDVSAVVRRHGTRSGLIVDVVDPSGRWRYLEDLPKPVLLTGADVTAATGLIETADWVAVQLRQPADAVLTAVRLAARAGAAIALDGAPPPDADRERLLAAATVIRADAREASLLAGTEISAVADARRAAADILRQGPRLVALAVGEEGNYFAWRDGELMLPLTRPPVADTTGAGDAFTAALITGLAREQGPERAARLAAAAGHPGGSPALSQRDLP